MGKKRFARMDRLAIFRFMSHDGHCKWIGGSGRRYTYAIYRLPCRFHDGQFGNHIFAKLDKQGRWVPVFIGEGELARCASEEHELWHHIMARGATHFHCHLEPDQLRRLDEEDDLLARYVNAYQPFGCNIPSPGVDPEEMLSKSQDLGESSDQPEAYDDFFSDGELSDSGSTLK